jgi:PAS domain S-box-containing protein
MAEKPSYEELEQRLNKLEGEASALRQAEEGAKRTEPEKRAILDSLLEHVVHQDTDMNVLWANQAACDSVGITREDFIGRRCYEVWAGRESTCEDCPVAKARDTGKPQTVEKMTPDGRWWYIQGYPVRDDSGDIVGMSELTLDITERKRAEDALRKAHDSLERRVEERTADLTATTERLRNEIEGGRLAQQALENSREMLSNVFNAVDDLLIVVDKNLRVVMSNWKGYEYVAEQHRKAHPHCYSCFMSRQAPCEPCHALEVFATGKMKGLEHVNPVDGKAREVRVLPIFDDEQNVTMVVEHLRDITERKRTEEALRESEAKYCTLVENSLTGIFIHQDGKYMFVNDRFADIHGYQPEELLGQDPMTLIHPDEREGLKQVLSKRLKGESVPNQYMVRRLRKDGETIWCEMMATRIEYARRPAVMGNVIDITQRKQAEDQIRALSHQLLQAQEMERQRLAYDLHDHLAQDLSALKIAFDTFCDHYQEISTGARQRMSELSKELHGVILAVRDLAYDLRPPGIDEAGLVDALDDYCEEYSSKSDLEVEFLPVGIDESELDFDSKITLYRLIQEALSNVRKHADASHVSIRLVASFPNIILRIEDDGRGFDVAARLAAASYEKRMGLVGMKERVALLGGTMEIQSRPAEGTKIVVEVPYGGKYHGK